MAKLKSGFLTLVQNKWFCLFWLLFGIGYVTVYGMLYVEDLFTEGLEPVKFLGLLLEPSMTATASIIGKTYFWSFKGWGLFQMIALPANILYLYRRYGFATRFAKWGKICLIIGSACITMCVMIRSTEEFGLQMIAHWSGALLFGFFYALALGFFLAHIARKGDWLAKGSLIFLVAMLALMLVLLAVLGKGGAIETIPMWGAYLLIFLLNFTNLYKKYLPVTGDAA